jgi:glycosyltransferase involved in cell wall biosynthesis
MRVALIAKPGYNGTGVGRYTSQLQAALQALGHEVLVVHPAVPLPGLLVRAVRRLLGWDLQAFLTNYPLWARYPCADIYHVTSQSLATLLLLRRPPGRTVVTVHDLIPWLLRDDPELRIFAHRAEGWFDRLALAGLRRADALIADSAFTLDSLARSGTACGLVADVASRLE